jgi:hypothetical protein
MGVDALDDDPEHPLSATVNIATQSSRLVRLPGSLNCRESKSIIDLHHHGDSRQAQSNYHFGGELVRCVESPLTNTTAASSE